MVGGVEEELLAHAGRAELAEDGVPLLRAAAIRLFVVAVAEADEAVANVGEVGAFLDELVTWREIGFNRAAVGGPEDLEAYESLPDWALTTLEEHASDPYMLEQKKKHEAETARAGVDRIGAEDQPRSSRLPKGSRLNKM